MSDDEKPSEGDGKTPGLRDRWKEARLLNKIFTIVGAFLVIAIIGGALSVEDEKTSADDKPAASATKEAQKSTDKKETKTQEPRPEKTSTKKSEKNSSKPKPPKRATEAKKIAKHLSTLSDDTEYGLHCAKWETRTKSRDDLAYVMSCKDDELLLASMDDKAARDVWLDSMDDKLKNKGEGYALVKDTVVLMSPDQGTINHVWDLLGASGKRQTVGSAPYSD